MRTKEELRKEIQGLRRRLPPLLISQKSGIIAKRLMGTELWRGAEKVFLYVSMPTEVQTFDLIAAALSEGKRVAVPKVTGEDLVFHTITSFDDLDRGYRGILEPVKEWETEPAGALLVLPGTAFDEKGNRLGYGRGFYDRYLACHPDCPSAALSFDFAVYPEIPAEESDRRVGMIITEKRMIEPAGTDGF